MRWTGSIKHINDEYSTTMFLILKNNDNIFNEFSQAPSMQAS